MSSDDKYLKKPGMIDSDDEDIEGHAGSDSEGESGKGGKGGQIEFKDFLSSNEHLRDDQLSPEERKRLLSVHQDVNKANVEKGKAKRDHYKDLKHGKITLAAHRQGQGFGTGLNSQYKVHPAFADKAQFSGITDNNINPVPTENNAETNNEKREELQYQYNLRYNPEFTPKFNPKPSPYR